MHRAMTAPAINWSVMKPRICTDYTYFNLGIAIGDIVGSFVLTFHIGFWSIEIVLRDMPEPKFSNRVK
jgi:hypothetical protein